jgi:2-amino-4-hydroxy-6-hydroxymethyldihydropteridine diphosphokinase/dihydropteroate synthase
MYSLTYLDPEARFPPISPLNPRRATYTMGILNTTPDSFSDGGKYSEPSTRLSKDESDGEQSSNQNVLIRGLLNSFSKDAASPIIDVGGQSTAPNTPEVSAQKEADRVTNVIKSISRDYPNHLISIDTYRASVAEKAMKAGAHMVNDVSAGQMDQQMLSTVARAGHTIILMHMRGTPATMTKLTDYEPRGLIPSIALELLDRVGEAQEAGIPRWRIILDPGIGFAKTAAQNIEILRNLDKLRNWHGLEGLPWLVGSSRKGFIGKITGVKKPEDRVLGSMVAVTAAIQGGADIVRVHDVKEAGEVVKMADAIWRSSQKVGKTN